MASTVSRLPLAVMLAALCIAAPAGAGWSHDPRLPNPIIPEIGSVQTVQAAVPDGNGGAFVFFLNDRAGNQDVYSTHLLPSGDNDPTWLFGGVPICTAIGDQSDIAAVSDGAGGAFVCWLDARSGTPKNYATRLLAGGPIAPGFPVDGVLIDAVRPNTQFSPKAVADGEGGMGVAWEYETSPTNHDIHSARVAANGAISWVQVIGGTAADDRNPSVGTHVPGHISFVWMMAPDAVRLEQREAVFGTVGVGIGNNSADITTHPKVAGDGWGGTLVAYVGDVAGTPSLRMMRLIGEDNILYTPITLGPSDSPDLLDFVYAGNFRNWLIWSNAPANDLFASQVTVDLGILGSVFLSTGGFDIAHPMGLVPHTGGNFLATFGRVQTVGATRLAIQGPYFPTFGGLPTPDGWLATQRPAHVQLGAVCSDGNGGALIFSHEVANNFNRRSYAMRVDRFGAYDGAPRIVSVKDVAGDQGGRVRLTWSASYLDDPSLWGPIDPYRVWRQVPVVAAQARLAAGSAQAVAGEGAELAPGAIRFDEQNGVTFAWEYVASQIAANFPLYSMTLESVADSTSGGEANTVYMVEAMAGGGVYQWASLPDSGHSVDNLAPATPSPFTATLIAGPATELSWGANGEADLAGYELHRGSSADFVPGPGTLVATVTGTSHEDGATGYFYKLAALDTHGNRSGYALVTPGGTLDAPGGATPRTLSLAVTSQNPSRDGAAFRYALPTAGGVSLAMYDVHGRLVREVLANEREAGEYVARWDGRETGGTLAPSGIYFARLSFAGSRLVRRVVLSH